MKYFILLIFVFSSIILSATKPFSTWELDGTIQLNFDEQECKYDFSTDTVSKRGYYRFTDVLTDENGKPSYYFDSYAQKIVVRDSNDITLGEVTFPEFGGISNKISSILLPFYDQKKCFFAYLLSNNISSKAELLYFELDYSVTPAQVSPIKKIPLTDLLQNVITATINRNGDGYFIGVANQNKEEIFIVNLNSNGNFDSKSYKLEFESLSDISFQRQLNFSPQGDKLVANLTSSNFNFFIFDNSSGVAEFKFYINMNDETSQNIRGALVFSQNGEKMYSQSGHSNYVIHQFDLSNYNKVDVVKSKYDIISIESNCVDCLFRDFRLAPNNKIYISYSTSYIVQYLGQKDSTYLGVINCPNGPGPFIDFELLGVATTAYIFPVPYIQKIPSNFLATPQTPTVYNRPDDIQQYCVNSNVTIKGADDPCGEHHWVKPNGSRFYSNELILDNISASDSGYYFYHFQSCYKQFNDTFQIRIIEKIVPKIVKVSPTKLDLCQNPLEDITFTTDEKYKEYKWYFTQLGSSNRSQVGSSDTVVVSALGVLELEVTNDGGCKGIASYAIEQAQIDYAQIDEYQIRICRGIEQSYSIDYPIKSDRALSVDSLSLRIADKMSIMNLSFIVDTYPNGLFNRNIKIDFNALNEGVILDTLDIYIDSECKKKITIPLKIIIESTKFALEVPKLKAQIGDGNFEIPIYLTTSCIEPEDDFNFEATLVLSKSKYFVNRVEGVNLINIQNVNDDQLIRISYDGSSLTTNGREQIGSLFGTVLLTNIDSTGILIQDTVSNYIFDLIDGSLVTDDICVQELRQVSFFDNQVDVSITSKTMNLNSFGAYRGNINFNITNYTGQSVAQYHINKDDETIERTWELTDIASGLYFLQIMQGSRMELQKIYIE